MTKSYLRLPRTAALFGAVSLVSMVALASLACLTPALVSGPASSATPRPADRGGQETPTNLVRTIEDPGLQETPPPHRCARVTAVEAVHVRLAGDKYARILGWFYSGTTLQVIDTTIDPLGPTGSAGAGWWKVSGTGIDAHGRQAQLTGFVHSNYLEEIPCLK